MDGRPKGGVLSLDRSMDRTVDVAPKLGAMLLEHDGSRWILREVRLVLCKVGPVLREVGAVLRKVGPVLRVPPQ
jgi:hypothetical protein